MNDSDDTPSLNSAPTMPGGGARHPAEPSDEPSLGSAPTMAPGGANGGASSSSEPPIGRIDRYELVRKLGGGGFGVVYLARDTVSGVEVALKTLHPLLKTNAEEMERLREKFALVSRLTHQNIAKALVLHPVREVDVAGEQRDWRRIRPVRYASHVYSTASPAEPAGCARPTFGRADRRVGRNLGP